MDAYQAGLLVEVTHCMVSTAGGLDEMWQWQRCPIRAKLLNLLEGPSLGSLSTPICLPSNFSSAYLDIVLLRTLGELSLGRYHVGYMVKPSQFSLFGSCEQGFLLTHHGNLHGKFQTEYSCKKKSTT